MLSLNQFIDHVIEKRYSPTTIRVILALLEKRECHYEFKVENRIARFKQVDIAKRIGTSQANVSKSIKRLKDDGMLYTNYRGGDLYFNFNSLIFVNLDECYRYFKYYEFIDYLIKKRYSPTTIRVILVLLENLEYNNRIGGFRQVDIAKRIGTSQANVSKSIKRLKDDGMLFYIKKGDLDLYFNHDVDLEYFFMS